MIIKNNYLSILILLFFILVTNSQLGLLVTTTEGRISWGGQLIEERTLQITFIGINDSLVNTEQLINKLTGKYRSEYPLGDELVELELTITIKYSSESVTRELTRELYNKTKRTINENSTEKPTYYIDIRNFLEITERLIKEPVEPAKTHEILIINFDYEGSPFEDSKVYINYTKADIDTNDKSLVRKYSDYGLSLVSKKRQLQGLIVSTEPSFTINDYPSITELKEGKITATEWNNRLLTVLEEAIWCRINPSPVFRYEAHEEIEVHIALIKCDPQAEGLSLEETTGYLDDQLLLQRINELVMIDNSRMTIGLLQASERLIERLSDREESYYEWLDGIYNHFTKEELLWEDYPIEECDYKGYKTKKDIYVAILIGTIEQLPWSEEHVGLSYPITTTSDRGGMAIMTMNNETILTKHEGLTLTVLHEIGHLLGLTHPHDYWQVEERVVGYSWAWGYDQSPMGYLTTGYEWNYYQKLVVFREQLKSLLTTMTKDYQDNELTTLLTRIRRGDYLSLEEEWLEVLKIRKEYDQRSTFHNWFITSLLTGTGMVLTTIIVVLLVRKHRER